MALIIRDTSSVPVERWQYFVVSTGFTVFASSWGLLWGEVVKHCEANGVGAPGEQEVIDWVCRELHVNCYEEETRVALVNKLTLGMPIKAEGCCGK